MEIVSLRLLPPFPLLAECKRRMYYDQDKRVEFWIVDDHYAYARVPISMRKHTSGFLLQRRVCYTLVTKVGKKQISGVIEINDIRQLPARAIVKVTYTLLDGALLRIDETFHTKLKKWENNKLSLSFRKTT